MASSGELFYSAALKRRALERVLPIELKLRAFEGNRLLSNFNGTQLIGAVAINGEPCREIEIQISHEHALVPGDSQHYTISIATHCNRLTQNGSIRLCELEPEIKEPQFQSPRRLNDPLDAQIGGENPDGDSFVQAFKEKLLRHVPDANGWNTVRSRLIARDVRGIPGSPRATRR